MSEYRLTQEILARSVARAWPDAKREWELREVYEAREPERCLCGHFPIIELCVLANRVNRRTATVGNCCARKFLGLPSDEIFRALKRVGRDPTRSLTADAIRHAFGIGWINEWERGFYLDILGKRKLSESQIKRRGSRSTGRSSRRCGRRVISAVEVEPACGGLVEQPGRVRPMLA